MARDFLTVHKARTAARCDPLQDVDETVPGFIPDPSAYQYGKPGRRRARTFSQTIADATRGIEAGAVASGGNMDDLGSQPSVGVARPDWRGHYDAAQSTPAPRASRQLATPGRTEELRRKFRPKAMEGG
jgi:hypothetical protein